MTIEALGLEHATSSVKMIGRMPHPGEEEARGRHGGKGSIEHYTTSISPYFSQAFVVCSAKSQRSDEILLDSQYECRGCVRPTVTMCERSLLKAFRGMSHLFAIST